MKRIVNKIINTVLRTPRFVRNPRPTPALKRRRLVDSLVIVYKCDGIFGSNAHDGVIEDLP